MTTRSAFLGLLLLGGMLAPACLTAQSGADSVRVNGVTLRYQVQGSGKPLVLVHGWALNLHEWDNIVNDLARHYRVIRYDRRGYGSSGGRPDPTADAADLKALLESLGVSRAYVMGHSGGAHVALTLAVRYPEMVGGLILFASGPLPGFNPPFTGRDAPPVQQFAVIAKTQGLDSLRAAIAHWGQRVMFQGRPIPPPILAQIQAMLQTYQGYDFLDPAPPSNLAPEARADELGKVKAPTLVLIGDEEMPYLHLVAEALTYGIPEATMVVVRGGGHALSLQEPERFTAEVLRFLRLVDAGEAVPASPDQ